MGLEIVFIIIGALLIIAGIIGCIVPVLPGPILSFAALILISIPSGFMVYRPVILVALGAAAVASQLLDNLLPLISSSRSGAGKAGIWGSVTGMIAGMIFIPPFGVIIGAFFGALIGEVLFNRENREPLKAALGVFTGTLLSILLKLSVSGIIAGFFIRGVRLIL